MSMRLRLVTSLDADDIVGEIGKEEAALEALARKERMNTPGRRAVFCVLMGAEDFADAVEKLSRMSAKGRAERYVLHPSGVG